MQIQQNRQVGPQESVNQEVIEAENAVSNLQVKTIQCAQQFATQAGAVGQDLSEQAGKFLYDTKNMYGTSWFDKQVIQRVIEGLGGSSALEMGLIMQFGGTLGMFLKDSWAENAAQWIQRAGGLAMTATAVSSGVQAAYQVRSAETMYKETVDSNAMSQQTKVAQEGASENQNLTSLLEAMGSALNVAIAAKATGERSTTQYNQ
jgi:hypothetical protein